MLVSCVNLFLCSLFLLTTASANVAHKSQCPIGKFPHQRKCVDCPPGTYNDISGASSCKPCPAGTFNPFYGSQGVDICQKCPENTFSKSRASTCKPCPAGTNSRIGTSECLSCGPGLFLIKQTTDGSFSLTEGQQLCTECPGGYYSDEKSNIDCKPCPSDFSSWAGTKSESGCYRCPSGTESSRTFSIDSANFVDDACYQCSPSSFKPAGGTVCRECPPGFSTSTIANTKCTPCPSGTFVDRETRDGVSVNAQCEKCPKGMIAPGKGNAVCRKEGESKCPNGFFKAEDSSCRKCGLGWRYDRNKNKCIMCPEDRVSSGGLNERCTRCPLSSMPNQVFGRFDRCICRDNFHIDNRGQCSKCPPGRQPSYLDRDGRQTCLSCPFDSFSSKRGMLCKKCSFGTIQHRGRRRCEKCPKGFFPNPAPFGSPGPRCLSGRTGCPKYTKRIVGRNGKLLGCKRRRCPPGTFREPVNMNYVSNRKSFGGCRACEPGERFTGTECVRCDLLSTSKGGLDRKCVRCGKGTIRDVFDGSKCVKGELSPYELQSPRG